MTTPVFRALLIGVDFYFPNELPDGSSFRSLSGCVADVTRMETLLRARISAPLEVETLLSSNVEGESSPPEPPEKRPTYANIKARLDGLLQRAQPGDQVFIHHSGHGGRVLTGFPELKGVGRFDETLVPIDIADTSTRYVRDVDLAYYLVALQDKGAITTLVFDACHSGGATRGQGIALRRATGGRGAAAAAPIDETMRPKDGVAGDDLLRDAWRRLTTSAASRGATVGGSLVPNAGGYVLLAACAETESAIEATVEGMQRGGVMTDAFLEALRLVAPGASWKTVHERVLAKVRSRFPRQTPQLVGEVHREVFGASLAPTRYTLLVAEVDVPGRRVKVDGGLAMGLGAGTEIGIHDVGGAAPEAPPVYARITEVGAIASWAEVSPGFDVERLALGAPVVVLDLPLRYKVHLGLGEEPPATLDEAGALAQLAAAIMQRGRGFLEESPRGETPHFQVSFDADSSYRICDPAGVPLRNVAPIPAVPGGAAAALVVERLIELGRYNALLDLHAPPSPLDANIHVELRSVPVAGAPPGTSGAPFEMQDGRIMVPAGTNVAVAITNRNDVAIHVAILDLGSDWSRTLLVPDPAQAIPTLRIPPGGSDSSLVLGFAVVPGEGPTIDVLKVIMTTEEVDLRSLAPTQGMKSASRGRPNALTRLMGALDADKSAGRGRGSSSLGGDFAVRDIRVHVRPPAR